MRLRPPPLACSELVELVTDYFEGAMSRRDRKRFEAHLDECDACSAYLEQMRLTIEATGRLSAEQIAPDAREALLNAFRDWKRHQPV